MATELKIPSVGESITEVEIGEWLKSPGDAVSKDEDVVTIESEKASVELSAPISGRLSKILKKQGQSASVGDVIAYFDESSDGKDKQSKESKKSKQSKESKQSEDSDQSEKSEKSKSADRSGDSEKKVMPAARKALEEHGLDADSVEASGPGGRLLKEDVLRHVEQEQEQEQEQGEAKESSREKDKSKDSSSRESTQSPAETGREEEKVPMSMLRRTIAKRLVEAQQTAALLTTFNEIDMQAVMDLRRLHQEDFTKKYEVKLGFMSFFVKACVDALKQVPQLNAEIRDRDIVYRNYFDIGIAIGGGKGLVVPVLQNAESMSFGDIEQAIRDFGQRAQQNQLKPEELQGGTFTISNGGVYGSLLSTPIVNPPQSGVLGLHAIQDRPVVRQGAVVIRPMMYVALTYDHRIVDGREAVLFLKRIKDVIEDPARMLLEA